MASGETIVLEVETREETGKNACRRLRAQGRVPGNVYGLNREPFMVSVDPKRIDALLRLGSGVNTIFTLKLRGDEAKRAAMIKELQRDPVNERPVHIDFVRVDATKKLQVMVPIQLIGTPVGVKTEGGVLDFVHREALVECLPGDIPEHLDVEVEELHIGQHVSLKDLHIRGGIELIEDAEQIVAVVSAPRVEEAEPTAEEEAAEAAEAGAEPAGEGDADKKPSEEGQ